MNLEIRLMRHADVAEAAALVVPAYGHPHDEGALHLALDLEPEGWLLATIAGRPAGMGGVTVFADQAVIGMMATHPDHQRCGVATAIFTRLLDFAQRRGVRRVALYATDVGARLYARHGFDQVELTDTWELSPGPGGEPRPLQDRASPPPLRSGAGALEPLGGGDAEEIAALDARAFGTRRDRLIARLVEEFPGRCFGIRDSSGRLRAHAIVQMLRIGPAVASSAGDAAQLLDAALGLPFEAPPRILVPRANGIAAPLLEARGFTALRFTRYMARGACSDPGDRPIILGLASYSLG